MKNDLKSRLISPAVLREIEHTLSEPTFLGTPIAVSYTLLRAHETPEHLVCRLRLEKKKKHPILTITHSQLLLTAPRAP